MAQCRRTCQSERLREDRPVVVHRPLAMSRADRLNWLLGSVSVAALTVALGVPASAQTWNNAGTGNWSNATNWTPNTVPNSSGASAAINNGGTADVDSAFTVGTLTIGATSTVGINDARSLTIVNSIVNHGTIQLNSAGNTTDLDVAGGATVNLSGGGTLILGNSAQNIVRDVTLATGKLVNVDNLIQGAGNLGNGQLSLDNQASAVIDANQSNALTIRTNSGNATNEGLLEATAGGTLVISSSTVTQTGGTILASGVKGATASTVLLSSAKVVGGTLTSTGGGVLTNQSGAINFLDNVTLSSGSTYTIGDNSFGNFAGTFTNKGTVAISSGGNATDMRIRAGTTLTLQGGGTVSMGNSGANFIRDADSATGKLINVDNLIQGAGQLGSGQLSLDNQAKGIVNANLPTALTLRTNGNGATNEGLLEATAGGTLVIASTTVDQTGGPGTILSTGAGSTVSLSGATITGGTMTSTKGGVLANQVGTVNFLNNVTLSSGSTYTIGDNSFGNFAGTFTNNGTVAISSAGNPTDMRIRAGTTLTLQGGGTISMGNNANNFIRDADAGTGKLINVNNLIQGSGQVGNGLLALDNQVSGVINANQSNALTLRTNNKGATNEGLVKASAGGTLVIASTVFDQTGGGITPGTLLATGAGSTVSLSNSQIIGGTLTTASGGVLQSQSGALNTLSDVTLSTGSTFTIQDNSFTTLTGTTTNKGTIVIASGGNATDLRVDPGKTTTLTGGGTISMGNNANNFIRDPVAGTGTLVNVDNLIQGAGNIGSGQLKLDNQAKGVIDANLSTTLTLQPNSGLGYTNEGLLEATSGGTLRLDTASYTQSGAGKILANGASSTVQLAGASVSGGTLTTSNGGAMLSVSGTNNTLTNLTISSGSTFTVQDNSITNLVGTITNNGSIAIASGGNATDLRIDPGKSVTLTGGGTVTMSNNGNNFIRDPVAGTATLINVNNTIQGSGNIGAGQLVLDNQASGIVDANQSTTLTLQPNAAGYTNEGLLEATAGGTLRLLGSTFTQSGSGTTLADGASTVLLSSTSIVGGTLTTTKGGTIATQSGTGNTLSGVTVSAGSTVTLSDNSTTFLVGTITNHGTIALSSVGNATDIRPAAGQTITLAGGGTVSLSNSAANLIRDPVAGTGVLDNLDNLIEGSGHIGNGQLSLINEAAGVVKANQSTPLILDPNSAGVTNHGTLIADVNSTMTVTGGGGLTNLSGGTLTGGTYIVNAGGTMNLPGSAIVTDAANVTLSGKGSTLNGAATPLETSLTSITGAGQLHVLANRDYTTNNTISNAGLLDIGGGTFTSKALTNSGTTSGFGTITNSAGGPLANTGQVTATGGKLLITQGVTGTTGNITIVPGASLDISGASAGNTVGTLLHNGTNLNLGSQNITVSQDYNNANFGKGNSFNNHANVTGTGLILAAGNTGLAVTGSLISGGTLALGNVHTNGTTNSTIDITNTGTAGPVLRGAIQNAGITSPAITLAAGNYGPLALGATTTANLSFNSGVAGSLSGQSFKVVTNFDNVPSQTVAVTGTAFDLANPIVTPGTIALGNFHVKDTVTQQAISVQNSTITNAAFQEGLDAKFGALGSGLTSNGGSITNLTAGTTDSTSMKLGISTVTSGAINSTATIALTSNGSTTSHLASTPLTAQHVTVTAGVYNLASSNVIAPVNIVAHVGDGGGSISQALTITNTAPTGAFSEGLDSKFGAYTPGGGDTLTPTFAGSITNLAAGSTDSSSMKATISTATAGLFNGNVLVAQESNGVTTSHLGITNIGNQTVGISGSVTGGVFTFATPKVNNPQPINFGNVRISSVLANQSLSISNTSPSASTTEALDGAVVSAPANFSASGSFNALAAGAPPNTSIQVGMSTATAGAQSGNVVLHFKSDGSKVAGDGTVTDITPDTKVAVQGNVYRLANPTLNTPAVTLAARVGKPLPTASLSVSNTSPDAFTEGLKASFGAAPAGFTNTGSIGNLAATKSDTASLTVGLASTGTSGITTGNATLNYLSTGAGTDGAADIAPAKASDTVALTGKVYQTAVAAVTSPPVDFGIVHVGDTVAPKSVVVANTASGALVDTITGSIAVSGAPFSVVGGGTLGNGVVAGSNSGSALQVGLSTKVAGSFAGGKAGSAVLTLNSHDRDLADAPLTAGPVGLSATINNYGAIGLANASRGVLTGGGTAYHLGLGTLTQGAGAVTAALDALNAVLGPADALSLGSFNVISGNGKFGLTLNPFTGLAAGDTISNALDVAFNPTGLGSLEEVIQLIGTGTNGSGWNSGLNVLDPTLTIDATIVPKGGSVPEPSSWLMLLSALTGLGAAARPWRRTRARSM